MFQDGYVIVNFTDVGMNFLSINVNHLYRKIFFKDEVHAEKCLDKMRDKLSKGLALYYGMTYVSNKIIYEDHKTYIDTADISQFNFT